MLRRLAQQRMTLSDLEWPFVVNKLKLVALRQWRKSTSCYGTVQL